MMNWVRKVNKLQFDITSHCNARCGACVRNQNGGDTEPELSLDHLSLDIWKRLCEEDTKGWYIGQLALNGNWGDPMMHPKLVEMVKLWATNHPETFVTIHTNGSMRGAQFWADLAKELRQLPMHTVNFAVDGLKDTHSIYRRRTDFDKILENIKSFTSVGGNARIIMTLFEHNKHQVEEVKNIAKELGCRALVTRVSHSKEMRIIDKNEDYTIHAASDLSTGTEMPSHSETRFDNDWPISDLKNSAYWIHIMDTMDETKWMDDKKCPWFNQGEVQIDPWGTVWPCCHVSLFGTKMTKHSLGNEADQTILRQRTENSLKKYSLYDVLSNQWFRGHLDEVVEKAKWKVCQRSCGVCE